MLEHRVRSMNKAGRLLLGVLTLLPLAGVFGLLGWTAGGAAQEGFDPGMVGFPLMVLVGTFILLLFYVSAVFNNPRLTKGARMLWAIILFVGNVLTMPLYWYVHVWRAPRYGH